MDTIKPLPLDDDLAGRNAVARLSHRHEQIINWLLENPHKQLRDCAEHFGYSQGWLSQLIHSDIFQAQLRERQDGVFVAVANDIPAKLRGLADLAIEKVSRMVEESEDPSLAVDVFDKALHRLGYAPQKQAGPAQPAAQVNVFQVSSADLAMARQSIVQTIPAGEQKILTNDVSVENSQLGRVGSIPAALPQSV
jgi:hypothetical protein